MSTTASSSDVINDMVHSANGAKTFQDMSEDSNPAQPSAKDKTEDAPIVDAREDSTGSSAEDIAATNKLRAKVSDLQEDMQSFATVTQNP